MPRKTKMVVYVAGPYTQFEDDNHNFRSRDANLQVARTVAIELWQKGFAVICPHLNTAGFEEDCKAEYDDYITADLQFLAMCDAIVMLPRWKYSKGAGIEHEYAVGLGIPVYEWPELPLVSPTITKYPEQCWTFREIIGQMYRLHLEKNEDYSPANVAGPGMFGIATRIWDKAVRLVNLNGIDVQVTNSQLDILLVLFVATTEICRRVGFKISSTLRYVGLKKEPKFESLADGWIDFSNYGVIGNLNQRGKWGK